MHPFLKGQNSPGKSFRSVPTTCIPSVRLTSLIAPWLPSPRAALWPRRQGAKSNPPSPPPEPLDRQRSIRRPTRTRPNTSHLSCQTLHVRAVEHFSSGSSSVLHPNRPNAPHGSPNIPHPSHRAPHTRVIKRPAPESSNAPHPIRQAACTRVAKCPALPSAKHLSLQLPLPKRPPRRTLWRPFFSWKA